VSVGNGLAVSLGVDASTGTLVSDGIGAVVEKVGGFVGMGEEQDAIRRRRKAESRVRIVVECGMESILTDIR